MRTSHSAQTQQRLIRVFVSSTFRDMQQERDELVKFIFPQLRKLCEQRGVTWGEVDLRWGITDEQKAEGKVLPICLTEIKRCRPYFIGLLGERYGWIPDEIPKELIEQEPWLCEHRQHSVTELEILHGVLNNPEMADHAFFYLRDPDYTGALPKNQQSAFREEPTAEEIKELGNEGAERQAQARRDKLIALKERICESGFPVNQDYRNPKQFGEWVLRDLTAVIERLYPEGSQPDPLDREAAEHEVFAGSRAKVYIGRQAYDRRLDAHAKGNGLPLVVLGESGSGKSALLANWALKYRQQHPEDLMLTHFIGATPDSTDWAAMLRRILGELQRHFDFKAEIPDKPEALRAAFANGLHMAVARGRVVLILDGLNQLEDRDNALDLVWLPPEMPADVRLVLSTLPGRPLDELQKRSWPVLKVEPLDPGERTQLIKEYLALFTKSLSSTLTERIAGASQCQNPLFLRALLDELRLFGMHETLEKRIQSYLKAGDTPALYEKILERCAQDYERERPGLVRDAMSLLWAARGGLSEAELLEMLGAEGQPLPGAYWSPLYLALEQAFVNRAGLLGFSHDYIRQAVQHRFLPTEDGQRALHLRLADYFEARELGPRKMDELPWQLEHARAWKRLYDLLADLGFVDAACRKNRYEVESYWVEVESNSPYSLAQAYRQVIDKPRADEDYSWAISRLLQDMGHAEEASRLTSSLLDSCRKNDSKNALAAALGEQAQVLRARGDLDSAMKLLKEEEQICRRSGNKEWLSAALNSQALILRTKGDLRKAMELHREDERILGELGDRLGLAVSFTNQGQLLAELGRIDEAMSLHKKAERIFREFGDRDGLAGSLGGQALILIARGDSDGAMTLLKEQERICRELGNKFGLQGTYGDQANILFAKHDLAGAMALQKEKERLCRELGNREGLADSLGAQANILSEGGKLDGVMALRKEEERIHRELGNVWGLAVSLANQGLFLGREMGQYREGLALVEQAYRIANERGFVPLVQAFKPIMNELRNGRR